MSEAVRVMVVDDHPMWRDAVGRDLSAAGPDGVEVLRVDPPARVLIHSASGEQDDVPEAVKAGATGYLVKSASKDELLDAVRRVARGDTVFTPGLAGLVLGAFRRTARVELPRYASAQGLDEDQEA